MNDEKKFNFAAAIKELEEINQWFQMEDVDLDDGLKKYRKGLDLINQCKLRLKEAENEFVKIKNQYKVDETTQNMNNSQSQEDPDPSKVATEQTKKTQNAPGDVPF